MNINYTKKEQSGDNVNSLAVFVKDQLKLTKECNLSVLESAWLNEVAESVSKIVNQNSNKPTTPLSVIKLEILAEIKELLAKIFEKNIEEQKRDGSNIIDYYATMNLQTTKYRLYVGSAYISN
tara:strand:+ start:1855 stop:2223 length:369 start_codon:yes stop_codon:yes gene_type:complete